MNKIISILVFATMAWQMNASFKSYKINKITCADGATLKTSAECSPWSEGSACLIARNFCDNGHRGLMPGKAFNDGSAPCELYCR